ncbi:hypothetical protein [Streptomyces sp. NPDC053048]|uniref:hypothetical protein n=1 Tax=Streptomyces sp. NPDC053048 TaxID=3365694 RepID=UPI0037D29189
MARCLVSWRAGKPGRRGLAPTGPDFASVIAGRKEIPARLWQLLNLDSGVNGYGLAVTAVTIALSAVYIGCATSCSPEHGTEHSSISP